MAKRERVSRIGELRYAQNGMCCKIPYRSLSLSDVTKECAMSRASEEEKCYGKPDAMLWYMELPLRCSLDYEIEWQDMLVYYVNPLKSFLFVL